nr:LysR substrate-binding domain-containing protein [Thiomicrorhabdus indica]
MLSEFLKENPKVVPKLSILSKAETQESLKTQQHELVITGRILDGLEAHFEAFTDQTLAVVAAPGNRLHNHAKLSLKSLEKQNLILPLPETSIRQTIDRVFAEEGIKLKPYMELGSYELIKQCVIADLGIGILPADAFRLEEYTGHLIRLNVADFPIHKHWYYAYSNKKELSLTCLAFIEFLQRYSIETHLKKIYTT